MTTQVQEQKKTVVVERVGTSGLSQVVMVDPYTIRLAPFNPATRVTSKALEELKQAIIDANYRILKPLMLAKDGTLGDGHRRRQCAIDLGIPMVPVIRTDLSLYDLWRITNQGTMPINAKSALQAVAQGFPVEELPKRYRAEAEYLVRIIGNDKELLNRLVTHGRSTAIVRLAKRVASYIDPDYTDDTVRQVIKWFESTQQQAKARKAMEDGVTPAKIGEAIRKGTIVSGAPKNGKPWRPTTK